MRPSVKRVATASMTALHQSRARATGIPKQWHAISVEAKPLSCAAAQDLRKKRFLSQEAPALPLEGCTKGANCPCTYKHHEDRRGKGRRKEESGMPSNAKSQSSERRISRGRRSED